MAEIWDEKSEDHNIFFKSPAWFQLFAVPLLDLNVD